MTKWKCSKPDCMLSPCVLETGNEKMTPCLCPFSRLTQPEWVKQEEPAPTATTADTLPDWCKVGEWVYAVCYFSGESDYYKIREIKPGVDTILEIEGNGAGFLVWGNHIKQARLRPYTADEMRGLVGKVIDRNGDRGLVSFYDGDINKVCLGVWLSADNIMEKYTIDGHPCGVLEHLNDNGEWVE